MQIFINGEAKQCRAGINIAALMQQYALDARKVAIERNLFIVARSLYASTLLEEGDRLEIVQFIGGG